MHESAEPDDSAMLVVILYVSPECSANVIQQRVLKNRPHPLIIRVKSDLSTLSSSSQLQQTMLVAFVSVRVSVF